MPQESIEGAQPVRRRSGAATPKVLKAPVEIQANLRLLQDSRDSLLITFADRNQRFQSFLVDIDRDRGMVALDELIPNTGERFLQNGEAFRVEAFHEGVRIAWECERPVQFGEHDGVPCYWAALPAEVLYHQRRNAYRASIKQSQPDRRGNRRGKTPRAAERTTAGYLRHRRQATLRRQCRRTPASRRDLRRLQRPVATGRDQQRDRTASRALRRKARRDLRRRPLQRDERPRPAPGGSLRLPVATRSPALRERRTVLSLTGPLPAPPGAAGPRDGRRPRAPATGDAPSPVAGDARR